MLRNGDITGAERLNLIDSGRPKLTAVVLLESTSTSYFNHEFYSHGVRLLAPNGNITGAERLNFTDSVPPKLTAEALVNSPVQQVHRMDCTRTALDYWRRTGILLAPNGSFVRLN